MLNSAALARVKEILTKADVQLYVQENSQEGFFYVRQGLLDITGYNLLEISRALSTEYEIEVKHRKSPSKSRHGRYYQIAFDEKEILGLISREKEAQEQARLKEQEELDARTQALAESMAKIALGDSPEEKPKPSPKKSVSDDDIKLGLKGLLEKQSVVKLTEKDYDIRMLKDSRMASIRINKGVISSFVDAKKLYRYIVKQTYEKYNRHNVKQNLDGSYFIRISKSSCQRAFNKEAKSGGPVLNDYRRKTTLKHGGKKPMPQGREKAPIVKLKNVK